jgi:hypothetical protein
LKEEALNGSQRSARMEQGVDLSQERLCSEWTNLRDTIGRYLFVNTTQRCTFILTGREMCSQCNKGTNNNVCEVTKRKGNRKL